MFTDKDPRDALASTAPKKVVLPAPAADCLVLGPGRGQPDSWAKTGWYVRGQNFVTHIAKLEIGDVLERKNHADEHLLIMLDPETVINVKTNVESIDLKGNSIVIIPPGDSRIEVLSGGRVQRLFTAHSSPDLIEQSLNNNSYTHANPTIASFQAWPEPKNGFKIRRYDLNVPDQPGRFGRIWRSTNFMINIFHPQMGPRDSAKLSPHVHDDFEQCSIGVDGTFAHHLRWPWTINRKEWRSDEHFLAPSPSVLIIPPTVEHTSESLGTERNQLVDVFCPPRHDFSAMEGWVLNADEYPTL
jgi:mannose-6-phosphate isomerase-like protein (cupin superfamily)